MTLAFLFFLKSCYTGSCFRTSTLPFLPAWNTFPLAHCLVSLLLTAPALLCPRDLLRLNNMCSLKKLPCATWVTGVLRKALNKKETEPSKPWPQVFLFSSGWPCSNPGVTIHTRARSKDPHQELPRLKKPPAPQESISLAIHSWTYLPESPKPTRQLQDSQTQRSPESSGLHQILRDYLLYLLFQMQFTCMPSFLS